MGALAKPRVRIGSDGSNARYVGDVARQKAGAAYMRGEMSSFFAGWRPTLRDPNDDVRAAWQNASARAVDAIHNSGWLAGGVEQATTMAVGAGLRLNAKPDAEALGWTQERASEWSQLVERRWETWANNPVECDLGGRQSIGQMTAAAFKTWFAHGEIVAQLPWHRRPFNTNGSKVVLFPPGRLVQANDMNRMVQGVRMDPTGFPTGYRFRLRPVDGFEREIEVRARDGMGRPQVVHVFDGLPGQVRGITPLAPALLVTRQFDQLANATLTAGLLQTIFSATVESSVPTDQVLQGLQTEDEQGVGALLSAKADWYENTKIDLGTFGKIAHLFPGESLKFNTSLHPNSNYEAFARMLLREIARCLGVTFEQLTGDYSGATYSSVRMATSEIWQIVLYRRANICARFLQPIYEAWMEEEIEAGRIPFDGGLDRFLQVRSAATRADWRGPAKPQADDLKFAKASETMLKNGVVPMEVICSELGLDWADVLEQLKREADLRKRLGLPEPQFGQGPAALPDDGNEQPEKEAS